MAVLDDVSAGAARTLFVVGEPGVGKTRLAAAVAVEAWGRGFTVAHGQCEEGLAAPYQPVVEAFGPWLADCPDAALARVVGPEGAELVRLWPQLQSRLGAGPSGGDPDTQRWRLFQAVTGLVSGIAAERPLMMVVDDLQWAEPSTILLLAHLLRHATARTALVATLRHTETGGNPSGLLGDIGGERTIDVLDLAGFDVDEVSEFVAVRANDQPPHELCEGLRRQTGGNPFFLGAVLDHGDDEVRLRRPDGGWIAADDLARVHVPRQVRDVITRRLSRLTPTARSMLEVAAVAGHGFTAATVRGVLGIGLDNGVDALDEAIAAALIREEDAGRLVFAHALVRYAVLEGLSRTRRARLHWRVGEQLERDHADGLSPAGEIAYHYASGAAIGDAATVVRTAVAAGEEALERAAFEEAADQFRAALATLERMRNDPDLRYRVLVSLGQALNAIADADDAAGVWLEAADVARRANDPDRLFEAVLGYGYALRITDRTEIIGLLDDVIELVGPDDSPLRAKALGWRAMPIVRGNILGTRHWDINMANDAVAMARRTGDPDAIASTLRSHLSVVAQGPDAAGMLQDAQELLDLFPVLHGPISGDDATVWRDLTRAFLRHGRRTEAERHLATANDVAERSGQRLAVSTAKILRAALATASGEFAESKRLAAEAAALAGHVPLGQLIYAAQILASRMEQGRLHDVIAGLRGLDAVGVDLPAWHVMLVGAIADAGHDAEAAAELARVVDADLSGYPHDFTTPLALRYLSEVCRQVDDSRLAARLLPHALPWAGQILLVSAGTSIEGAADRCIGHLLAALGRLDDADDAYTSAAGLERRAGFPPLVARTEYWHARALIERDAPGDHERAGVLLDGVIEVTHRLGMLLLADQATHVQESRSRASWS
jgi:tetratricopeptide (TPR) repeat protein